MNTIDVVVEACRFNRTRTLGLLDKIEEQENAPEILGWRPGEGRAHIAWQLMHIGVSEEIFATERLNPSKEAHFTRLWPRFRGGSTPDDDVPPASLIRKVLGESRERLIDTLTSLDPSRLDEIPPAWSERGLSYQQILHIIAWHEGHHQGQAHITLNLHMAQRG